MIPPVVTRTRVERLRADGVRIRETRVRPGEDPEVWFTPDLDLLVHVLVAELGDVRRVDVEIGPDDPAAPPAATLEHVPFDAAAGAVHIACQRHYRGMGYPDDLRFRIVAVDGDARRPLGEYVVRHRFPDAV
jgi:hypothetical protein